jgi:hypothetical protein
MPRTKTAKRPSTASHQPSVTISDTERLDFLEEKGCSEIECDDFDRYGFDGEMPQFSSLRDAIDNEIFHARKADG